MQTPSELVFRRYGALLGERFGDLTLSRIGQDKYKRARGLFLCSCGGAIEKDLKRVLSGTMTSHCGCKSDYRSNLVHGMRGSSEYRVWQAVKRRCLCPTDKDYPRYGGRGIDIDPEWVSSFEEFFAHIGPRPDGTSIDRIDVQRGYVPGNVRWATVEQQARNKRTTYRWSIKGVEFDAAVDAAKHFGVSTHTVWVWTNGSFDKRRGTFTPPRKDCYATPRY